MIGSKYNEKINLFNLFNISRAAMMSGSVLAPWAFQVNPRANARILANNLRCYDYDAAELLQCLQVIKNFFCLPKNTADVHCF